MQNNALPFLTDDELDELVPVVKVTVRGEMNIRGSSRQESRSELYKVDVEVPAVHHIGHIKTAVNRQVRLEHGAIRARTIYIVPGSEKKQEHFRAVREFMGASALRDNERIKQKALAQYEQEKSEREADSGQFSDQQRQKMDELTRFKDTTIYGADGLPKFSDRLYVTG